MTMRDLRNHSLPINLFFFFFFFIVSNYGKIFFFLVLTCTDIPPEITRNTAGFSFTVFSF